MQQVRSPREHSQTRPIQTYGSLTNRVIEPQQLTNIPYSGSTTFQVIVNNLNPMAEKTFFRPPSQAQTYRQIMTNLSPRSKAGHSREKSIEQSIVSNFGHDDSLRERTVRGNYGKTMTKHTIHNILPQVPRESRANNKENSTQMFTIEQVNELLRHKQEAESQCHRLRYQLSAAISETQNLKSSLNSLQSQHQQSTSELAKSKHLLANYSVDMQRLTKKCESIQEQNQRVKGELLQAKNLLPQLMKRFDRLERMNTQLEETVRKDREEWERDRERARRL